MPDVVLLDSVSGSEKSQLQLASWLVLASTLPREAESPWMQGIEIVAALLQWILLLEHAG
jgi:hypothetical protein